MKRRQDKGTSKQQARDFKLEVDLALEVPEKKAKRPALVPAPAPGYPEYYERQNKLVAQVLFPNVHGLAGLVSAFTDDRPYLKDGTTVTDFISKTEPSLWIEHPLIFAALKSDYEKDIDKWRPLSEYYRRLQESTTQDGRLFKWLSSELKTSGNWHQMRVGLNLDIFLGRLDGKGLAFQFSHPSEQSSLLIWREGGDKRIKLKKNGQQNVQVDGASLDALGKWVPALIVLEVRQLVNATGYYEAITAIKEIVLKWEYSLKIICH